MPKIAATPEFVNRSTLLPKRGPQAAAVAPASAVVAPAGRWTPQRRRPTSPPKPAAALAISGR